MSNSNINSKEDFANFLASLADALENGAGDWQNKDLLSFLRAAQSWTEDMGGYYKNMGVAIDFQSVNWRVFADILTAAKVYE